jgi:acyl-coenzyme A thioesterase PaaI-like protein
MPADQGRMAENLRHFREEAHAHCVVCGAHNPQGLRLSFQAIPDGSVQAVFAGRPILEGYPATLHGGIICSLLDGAMTNCLAAHGHRALTAELIVRFRRPVASRRPAIIHAWIERSGHQLFRVAADLQQDGQVMASATGKFMEDKPSGESSRGNPDHSRQRPCPLVTHP